MQLITDAELVAHPEYSRWSSSYRMLRERVTEIAGDVDPRSVLEVAPRGLPVFHESDVLDVSIHPERKISYRQDAGLMPWQVTQQYDLLIGLDVWHLFGKTEKGESVAGSDITMVELAGWYGSIQPLAFREAYRVGRTIILTFPLDKRGDGPLRSRLITPGVIANWTCHVPPDFTDNAGGRRIMVWGYKPGNS